MATVVDLLWGYAEASAPPEFNARVIFRARISLLYDAPPIQRRAFVCCFGRAVLPALANCFQRSHVLFFLLCEATAAAHESLAATREATEVSTVAVVDMTAAVARAYGCARAVPDFDKEARATGCNSRRARHPATRSKWRRGRRNACALDL